MTSTQPYKITVVVCITLLLSACGAPAATSLPTPLPTEPLPASSTPIPATDLPIALTATVVPAPSATAEITNTPEPRGNPHNTPSATGAWTNIEPGGVEGQTFLMGENPITSIAVGLLTAHPGNGGDQLTLWLEDSAGTVLGTAYAPVDDGFKGWLTFTFAAAIEAEAGSEMTMYLKDTGLITFGWRYAGNTYADGVAIMGGEPAPEWDFFFRVNPTPES